MVVKNLILIRHGQGHHNALFAANRFEEGRALRDPVLTDLGIKQCSVLNDSLSLLFNSSEKGQTLKIDVVISSPMKRALETTNHVFKGMDVPVVVSPLPTEMSNKPSNYGVNPSEPVPLFPHYDFSLVTNDWWPVDETDEQMMSRAEKCKEFLVSRPEENIAVVAHGLFLGALTNIPKALNRFKNCDLRSYQLDSETLQMTQSAWSVLTGNESIN